METCMCALISKQLKIISMVILLVFDAVNGVMNTFMMHYLFWPKITSKALLHDKAMFKNIIINLVRMVWRIFINISIGMMRLATLPSGMVFSKSSSLITMFTYFLSMFFRHFFSFPRSRYFQCHANFSFMFFGKRSFLFTFLPQTHSLFSYIGSNINTFRHDFLLNLKRLRSACSEITVKLSTHTKSRVLSIKNLLSLNNLSIAQNIRMSII